MIDWGHANFSDSAAARSVVNAANPLSPGGLNPRQTHLPTLAWVVIFGAVAFLLYHTVIRK
jgi:hypothetical protein